MASQEEGQGHVLVAWWCDDPSARPEHVPEEASQASGPPHVKEFRVSHGGVYSAELIGPSQLNLASWLGFQKLIIKI